MVKFPHIGLLLKLFADAFLVMQLADKNAEVRQNGSKFRDELKELAKGNSLENFKNCVGYLLTQLTELDKTGLLFKMVNRFIEFYRQILKENHGRQATSQEVYDWLLIDACCIVTASINLDYTQNQLSKIWFLPDLKSNKSALGVLFDFLKQEYDLTPY
jgi:hypothetical protein